MILSTDSNALDDRRGNKFLVSACTNRAKQRFFPPSATNREPAVPPEPPFPVPESDVDGLTRAFQDAK
jgi:hypothetical protein